MGSNWIPEPVIASANLDRHARQESANPQDEYAPEKYLPPVIAVDTGVGRHPAVGAVYVLGSRRSFPRQGRIALMVAPGSRRSGDPRRHLVPRAVHDPCRRLLIARYFCARC